MDIAIDDITRSHQQNAKYVIQHSAVQQSRIGLEYRAKVYYLRCRIQLYSLLEQEIYYDVAPWH